MLSANIIDLDNQWVSLRWPQSHDIVNDPLLEWHTSWIHAINSTHFDDKLQSILPDFSVLVRNPLASKLGELFIVLADNDLERFAYQIFLTLNHACSFDEKTKSSNNGFFTLSWITDDLGYNLTH